MSKVKDLKEQLKKQIEEQNKITPEERAKEFADFKSQFQRALYYFTDNNKFIGNMLQEMYFKAVYSLPTAALMFDKKRKMFEIGFNPKFFLNFELPQQEAILHHEILHFTHQHILRMDFAGSSPQDMKLKNVAADMAINQYINNLPTGCIDVSTWKLKDGNPFPKYKTSEEYYKLINENKDANKEKFNDKGEYTGGGEGQEVLDDHFWEELSEEDKKDLADEMRKLIKRTMEKTEYGYNQIPDSIKELLDNLTVFVDKFNAKQILMNAIKKSASFTERKNTWKRPSKRYGMVAPGSTNADLPKVTIYSDTSGSRSIVELNTDIGIIKQFLKAGNRQCMLGLWHTSLYHKKKLKMTTEVFGNDIESGGTDINCVVSDINKTQPDLAIILTDGYYGWDGVLPSCETIFIIVDNGDINHPMKNKVKTTIQIKNLK